MLTENKKKICSVTLFCSVTTAYICPSCLLEELKTMSTKNCTISDKEFRAAVRKQVRERQVNDKEKGGGKERHEHFPCYPFLPFHDPDSLYVNLLGLFLFF